MYFYIDSPCRWFIFVKREQTKQNKRKQKRQKQTNKQTQKKEEKNKEKEFSSTSFLVIIEIMMVNGNIH